MHINAVSNSDCPQMFSAAGRPNYIKSADRYLQNMFTLESDNLAVFQKFDNGFHVIRRTDHFIRQALAQTWGSSRR